MAIKQIYTTLIHLKNEFIDYRLDARIVGSGGVTRLKNDPKYRILAKEILPTGGTIIIATNNNYSENI